ncbi:PREDICTED: uncharacterized protein LOC108746527 [Trachymyrmex septentrionalis]|uniref:uncharacterized protein LOC108746527 n=1 Tax=Trachymyrmex septentrionalis TaxID=34720 RepID=UPI00084F8183|nr:PREDICTED: uncharacterized protein LOC108746527 [Trachymyrmex septentrionalis]
MGLSYDSALIQQKQFLGLLARAVENFKKIGPKNITVAIARSRLVNVEKYWERILELNAQLEELATDEDRSAEPYFTDCLFYAAEETFLGASDYITACVDKLTPSTSNATPPIHNSTINETQSQNKSPFLPRITLPKFSGNYTDWVNFRDIFASLVHSSTSLSNVERFHYLKSSLTGDAALVLKNISITDANYASAWNTLNSRYNNPRAIVNAHLSALCDLAPVKHENATELQFLRDRTNDVIAALTTLERPVSEWDDLLVFLTVKKLDKHTRMEWEFKLGDSEDFPSYDDLDSFLSARIRALESVSCVGPSTNASTKTSGSPHSKSTRVLTATEKHERCTLCANEHQLYQCQNFKTLELESRMKIIRDNNRCINCLRVGHAASKCRSKFRCARCKGLHHTLLHQDRSAAPVQSVNHAGTALSLDAKPFTDNTATGFAASDIETSLSCPTKINNAPDNLTASNPRPCGSCNTAGGNGVVFLATATVVVKSPEGRTFRARALLDSGSESTFISEHAVQALRAKQHKTHIEITGVGAQAQGLVRALTNITIEPRDGQGPTIAVRALILKKLSSYKPTAHIAPGKWPHISGLPLADIDPSDPVPIDLLIGADLYGQLLLDGLRKGPLGSPTAQRSIFGWLLIGPSSNYHSIRTSATTLHCSSVTNVDSLLKAFWEVEEVNTPNILSEEDLRCEQHFASTHQRLPNGRYMVRLPLKDISMQIGATRQAAKRLLEKSECQLIRQLEVLGKYKAFMTEYRDLGHMMLAPPHSSKIGTTVYLPHHPVFKQHDPSSKIRIVFNASHRSSDGSTLNDHLLCGPKLQSDLPAIILRWRQHRYIYTADIEKMFRQILVHPDDRDYQRILWRDSPSEPIAEYQLATVTYGTACAPYLALRVLRQLAHDERAHYPRIAGIIEEDTYIDDIFFGADDIQTLREMRTELVTLMSKGGFTLKKWYSNEPLLLADISATSSDPSLLLHLDQEGSTKVLGIHWHPATDSFRFSVTVSPTGFPTKRLVLSEIAKLFDPLGWVSPVTIRAKILLQELWLRKGDWDDPLPEDLARQWQEYCRDLPALSRISIPRWTGQRIEHATRDLHGFADASNRAYAAVVYQRVLHPTDPPEVTLLVSKTKVAPIKTLSIPRLELCAASLLAKLMSNVVSTGRASDASLHCWTDSTVVLSWLNEHASRWKTFVANRVSDIQTRLPTATWRHVPSKHNPADIASRGISPSELATTIFGGMDHSGSNLNLPSGHTTHSSPYRTMSSPVKPQRHKLLTSARRSGTYPRNSPHGLD